MKLLTTILFMLFAGFSANAQTCALDRVDLRWEGGAARFSTEVAQTPEEKAKGLMFRENLGRFASMLFVYEEEQPVAYWMENTLIPLDMLFFNGAGVLEHIHENAVPLDRTGIPGGENIQYVLEINGGTAQNLGIKTGAELRHPSLAIDMAKWGC